MNPSPRSIALASSSALACEGCGFDLRAHSVGSRCPECGRTTYRSTSRSNRKDLNHATEAGQGLLTLSIALSAIPLSGVFLLAAFGGPLATLAIFGPVFHLASTWKLRSSVLNTLAETAPWRSYSKVAAIEVVLGLTLITIMLMPMTPSMRVQLWHALAGVWVVLSGLRLCVIDLAAARVLGSFGLTRTATVARWIALGTLFTAMGVASAMSIFTTYATGTPTIAFWIALSSLAFCVMLALLSCKAASFFSIRVDGNLHYEFICQRIDSKEEAHRLNAGTSKNPTDEELAPIPLTDMD